MVDTPFERGRKVTRTIAIVLLLQCVILFDVSTVDLGRTLARSAVEVVLILGLLKGSTIARGLAILLYALRSAAGVAFFLQHECGSNHPALQHAVLILLFSPSVRAFFLRRGVEEEGEAEDGEGGRQEPPTESNPYVDSDF